MKSHDGNLWEVCGDAEVCMFASRGQLQGEHGLSGGVG
jgi:hypothetical protein